MKMSFWSWHNIMALPTCVCAEHLSSLTVATGAVAGSILICRRCSVFVGAVSFITGLGLGVVVQEWFLWPYRQQGMYNELLRRLSLLDAELRSLKQSLLIGGPGGQLSIRMSKPSSMRLTEDEEDIFQDTRSRRSSEDDYETGESDVASTSSMSVRSGLLSRLDRLLEGNMQDKQNAYTLCLSKKESNDFKDNAEFQWRYAKTIYNCSQSPEIGDQVRRGMVYEAVEIARLALSLDDQCSGAHKWLAILLGVIGLYEGTQQKILNGYKFKEHIDIALTIDSSDFAAHHLRGRWCYGVYMLSWIERKLAATLFATPPTASIEDAIKSFLEADRLKSHSWRENNLYLAKCYVETRNYSEAAKWLRIGQDLPSTDSPDDIQAKEEIDLLLAKYAAY